MAHLGDKLKEYRDAQSMSQAQLADYLRISLRTLQGIEKTGEVKKAGVISTITNLTGIDTQEFAHKPPSPILQLREPAPSYSRPDPLQELILSNKLLADSNKALAESNKSIARSHEELVAILKHDRFSSSYLQEKHEADLKTFGALIDSLAKVGVDAGTWKSVEEGKKAVGKIAAGIPEVRKGVGKT